MAIISINLSSGSSILPQFFFSAVFDFASALIRVLVPPITRAFFSTPEPGTLNRSAICIRAIITGNSLVNKIIYSIISYPSIRLKGCSTSLQFYRQSLILSSWRFLLKKPKGLSLPSSYLIRTQLLIGLCLAFISPFSILQVHARNDFHHHIYRPNDFQGLTIPKSLLKNDDLLYL